MTLLQKIIIGVLGTIVTVSSTWYLWQLENKPQDNPQVKQTHQIITGQTPDGFFDTFPQMYVEENLDVSEPIPDQKPVEPKIIVKWLRSSDLFEKPQKAIPPKPDMEEIKRNQILSDSLFEQKFTSEVVTWDKPAEAEPHNELPDINRDEDFSAHGVPSVEATYPVHLERVLTMNKHIPVVLYTEIQSELPTDKVIAVVEQNVTGYHGRHILIPRGSQAIGRFGTLKSPDSERMGITWYRILTPEGINITLTAEAVDQEGASGLTGIIDKRWKDKYGTALIFSSIAALAQLSVPIDNENAKAAADSFSAEIGPIVAEQLRQSLNIVQRINIPKGTRFNISPLVDIWFKESEAGRISALPLQSSIFNTGRSQQ